LNPRRTGRGSNREKKKGKSAFLFFLLTLFFAPLAFGTTESWSIFTLELLIALSCLFFLQPFSREKKIYYHVPGLLPLLLLLAWMFLQSIPLPIFIVRSFAPNIFHTYQLILDASGLTGAVSPDHWIPLTINRQASLFEALRLSSYACFYILTVQLLTSSKKLLLTVKAVCWLALCIAFIAVLQRMTAPDTLFWFRQLAGGKTAFGPWVYKNHYAGFMVMLCPLLLSQFILHRPSKEHFNTVKERILSFFADNDAAAHLMLGFGTIVLLVSVMLTQSRGGILSITCAIFLFFMLFFRFQGRVEKLPLFVIVTGVLVIVGWYSWNPILERFAGIIDGATGRIKDDRLLIWADSLQILADFPITGTGLGTFVDIFPRYKTIPDSLLYEHAHNDFLELLTDGGVLTAVLALWFISVIVITGYRNIWLRRDKSAVILAIGVLSGLAGIFVFSMFDFNLHNGANGLYCAFFCGLLVSAGNTRRYYQTSPTLLVSFQSTYKAQALIALGVTFFLCLILFIQGKKMMAEGYYQQAKFVASMPDLESSVRREKMVRLLEKAHTTDPLTGLYAYALANIRRIERKNDEALVFSSQAVLQQPMHFAYLQQLGRLLASVNRVQAQQLMETGYRRGQQKNLAFRAWAEFELSRYPRKKRLEKLQKELKDNTRLRPVMYPLLIKYQLDQEGINAVLPERTADWFAFWRQVQKEQKTEQYAFVLGRSLDFIEKDSKLEPYYFNEVARYYRLKNMEKKEESVLLLGAQYLPDYAPFHIQLADIYLKRGEKKKAAEQFNQALLLDPKNKVILHEIKKMKLEK
jgi:O-antigen ligase